MRILNHLMVPFCRYRTIARLSGSFVLCETFERERKQTFETQSKETRKVRAESEDHQGTRSGGDFRGHWFMRDFEEKVERVDCIFRF